uniref:DNA repair protein n=1 Tax=Mastacembelus armatus TaxID=205130 RepID=A0A3Q3KXI8_9TELE
MNWDHLELDQRVVSAVRRGNNRQVLCFSGPDLQRLTGLSRSDVQQLLTAAATTCRRHPPVSALLLYHGECRRLESGLRLGVGCPVLNELLRGGLPVGGVTELSGESGAGKTQLALQLCLSVQYPTEHKGLNSGAVYISTEDSFPIRRLQQLIREQSSLRSDVPPSLISSLQFSDHIYIEHAADLESLQVCLSRRVPLLLARGLVRLVVVDSVAALFRSEFQAADWLERNKQLIAFSSTLHHLSQEFTTPVLCINQHRNLLVIYFNQIYSCSPLSSNVSPALGLAWANQVMVRLMMWRLQETVVRGDQSSVLRKLEVVFAPHLARDSRDTAVWREGVQGVYAESDLYGQVW